MQVKCVNVCVCICQIAAVQRKCEGVCVCMQVTGGGCMQGNVMVSVYADGHSSLYCHVESHALATCIRDERRDMHACEISERNTLHKATDNGKHATRELMLMPP